MSDAFVVFVVTYMAIQASFVFPRVCELESIFLDFLLLLFAARNY